jgi:group I intron endonuclease
VRIIQIIWAHKNLSAETLAKISDSLTGKTHSVETLSKMSITKGGSTIYVYSSDGSTLINTFPSARNAAKHFNVGKDTILRYIKSGKLFKGKNILSIKPKLHSLHLLLVILRPV